MKNLLSIAFSALFFLQNAYGQADIIYLENPSFEGTPAEGSLNGPMIKGWHDCGFPGETIPDIHPKPNNAFGVTTQPFDGKTYLGLVIRDNETWERIGQGLDTPMKAGILYEFRVHLARSLIYESQSKTNTQLVNFSTPCKLRIWGGNLPCEMAEMLGESGVVTNSRWLVSRFGLKPSKDYRYLVLEAFYNTPVTFPYNGNLLLDNASNLVPIDTFIVDQKMLDSLASLPALDNDNPMPDDDFTRFEFAGRHMGTDFKIVFYADSTLAFPKGVADKAFARIAELEQVFSDYREDSEVSQLSALAGTGKKMRVSNDLWSVLLYSRNVADRSKGAFDFTAGSLTKIWRRAFRQKEMPSEAEIKKALKTVGNRNMTLGNAQEVELWFEGTQLDFGGIAKGYAVDEALKVLEDNGITSALVDGGGDIAVSGPPPGKSGWTIKRTVYGELGKLTTEPITIVHQAIATSGDTEKYLEIDGKRYSHIIDPRTGYGVTKREIVSVVALTCAEADAWATALSVEVVTKAYVWMKKQGMRAYFSR